MPRGTKGKKIRHIDKKDIIRHELMKLARAKPLVTECYSDFGDRTDTRPRGPSKAVLDLIAEEEKAARRPDITVLLVRKVRSGIGYPGQIDGKPTRNPTRHEKARARQKLQEVIDLYNRGAHNPF
jgi:hypothetical protein